MLDLTDRQRPGGAGEAGRICIVTGEIAGPDYNGGIGTANRGLALALQSAGFSVDVLYTQVESGNPFSFRGSFQEQVASFRALGVNLMCIDHPGRWDDWLAKSLLVMEILQNRSYDVVFFDDTHGTAYYTALARRSGSPALAQTKVVVVTHGSTQWISDLNQHPITTLASIRLLEIERRSIELADYVVSPSAYILRKYQSFGWTLPANTLVRPNILPFSAERAVPPSRLAEIEEIVFFGRLERRKGLWLFCEVLDRIKYELNGKKVTFLGKFTSEDGESTGFTLLRRSAHWPFVPTLLYNYDRDQALAYLKAGKRLAVMPSREDNSPCVILECLIEGIPFIASSGSGGQELISKADHRNCLFEPTVDGLTDRLRTVLAAGATTGQPSFRPQDNARQTIAWVSGLVSDVREERATANEAPGHTAAPQAEPMGRRIILLAPEDMSPELIRETAREVALRHADGWVVVFAENVAPLALAATPGEPPMPDNLSFCAIDDFAAETTRMQGAGGMLVLGRLDQPIATDVLARAEAAFRTTDIAALTMMRGHAIDLNAPEQPYVCTARFHWQPEEYKTGNASVLMSLAQDSNAGLVVLRSEHAPALARMSPRDPYLCKLRDVKLLVHELLLTLLAAHHSFELMPDCFLVASAMSPASETYELSSMAMRHLSVTRNMPAGSEPALLSRLSVDVFAGEAARRNALGMLAGVAKRVGEAVLDPENYWPPSRAFINYAKIAHATGRPELALSLMASSLASENPFLRADNATPASMAMRRARAVELASLVAEGRHGSMNLHHAWSLRVNEQHQEIELHPNSATEGDATLVFTGLTFAGPTEFCAEIELDSSATGPVRFEIELQAPGIEALHEEWVLQPGERKSVEFPLPDAFQRGCDALLATRLVRRRDTTEGAHAKWHGPAFRPL